MTTIRETLANDTDPADVIDEGHLNDIIYSTACTAPANRPASAASLRASFDRPVVMANGELRYQTPEVRQFTEWEIELLEDPELLQRVIDRTRIREQVIADIDAYRHGR
jgi:hypothetical protein